MDAEIRSFVAGQWVELEQDSSPAHSPTPSPSLRTPAPSSPQQRPSGARQGGRSGHAGRYYYNLVSQRITKRLPGGAAPGDVSLLASMEGPKDRVMPSRNMLVSGALHCLRVLCFVNATIARMVEGPRATCCFHAALCPPPATSTSWIQLLAHIFLPFQQLRCIEYLCHTPFTLLPRPLPVRCWPLHLVQLAAGTCTMP